MLIEESLRRQKELEECVKDMASAVKEGDELRKIAIKLKGLYTDGFRHIYYRLFSLIVEIAKDDNADSLDSLSNNIMNVRALVEQDSASGENEFQGLGEPLTKLSDHINLEIARYTHLKVREQRILDLENRNKNLQTELADATGRLEEVQKTMSSVQTELAEAKKSLSSVQTEVIAVLSIFAAIVLTFSGSMSLLGNALTGMQNAPFFKSVFFVLLCGFVITNVIFLMMYLVSKITGRNIYARCKSEDCTCGEGGVPKCGGLKRIRKRLPYVYWVNFLVLCMMAIDVVVWLLDKFLNFIP